MKANDVTFERLAAMLREEIHQPLQWWYLSFATEQDFNGAVYVEARGFASAFALTTMLNINPHGEVMGVPVPQDKIPDPKFAYRLLSKEEVQEATGEQCMTLGEWEAEEDAKKRPQ